jgi:hypothetical protein
MSDHQDSKTYSLEKALKAQAALRTAAGLETEQFPVQAFVGMISDEIQVLREQGHTDERIAKLIQESSGIPITAQEIDEHYATPEERQSTHA